MKPKFPDAHIAIDLDGEQGNVFFIVGETRRAMKEAGALARHANQFNNEAMAHDYNHLLDVVERYVNVTWSGTDPRMEVRNG